MSELKLRPPKTISRCAWRSTKICWNESGSVGILASGIFYFKARAKSAARNEQCSSHEWSLSSNCRFASGTHVFPLSYQPFSAPAPAFLAAFAQTVQVFMSVEDLQPPAAEAAVTRQPGLWSSIREAIRGSHQDFTSGSLNRAILLLAIPMVLEMVLESLFAVVDVFWVGRLGADAVATVGLTESLLSLVFAVGLGLSLSTTAMVARRIGEKDPEGAAVAGAQAIFLGFGVSAIIGIPCWIYGGELLRLMGASPAIVATGSGYARIALSGSGVVLLLFLNNAIFRGAGDAAVAMRLLWVSNIINLILDPCFIFGIGPFPKLGVTGAAVATFTGRRIGVACQFYRLMRGTGRIRIVTSRF